MGGGLDDDAGLSERVAGLVGDVDLVGGVASWFAEHLLHVHVGFELDVHRAHVTAVTGKILKAIGEDLLMLKESGLELLTTSRGAHCPEGDGQ